MPSETFKLHLHHSINDYHLNGSLFLCGYKLREYFEVPVSAKTIYVTLYANPGKNRYRVEPSPGHFNRASIDGAHTVALYYPFRQELCKFLSTHKKVYVGIEYEY